MEGNEANRIKLLCGVIAPVVAILVLLTPWFAHAALGTREAWLELVMTLPFIAMIFSPFPLYFLGIRTITFTVLLGGLLLAITVWVAAAMMTSTSSTAGLMVLWIPFLGYPLVAVGGLLDWLSRRTSTRPKPRRWRVEARDNTIEIIRRRGAGDHNR